MRRTAAVFLALTFLGSLAWAKEPTPKEQAKKLVDQAATDYKLGRFEEALAGYSKAYELFKAPAVLFNIGQCHYRLKHWERAIFFYEGYLRDKPDAANRTAVRELIDESRGNLDKEEAAQRAATDEAERQREAEEARRIEAARATEAARVADQRRLTTGPTREPSKPIYKKWWFWTAVGATAVVATGATLYYFSGEDTIVPPMGSVGTIDGR